MQDRSRLVVVLRRAAAWSMAAVFSAGLYLLLIDTTSLPELLVGAGAVTLAASGFELAREQHIAGETMRIGWLARMHRPLLRVPADIVIVSAAAFVQLVRREPTNGAFRAVPFRRGGDERLDVGRRALAEGYGSLAPNTIIVGVDADRELILAHQLRRTGGAEAIDLLRLG
jgi:hypothetical protein